MCKGIMRATDYKQILIHHMIPSANDLFSNNNWIFQHDNDPKHTAVIVTKYLQNNGINVLKWPSQSPDLNPIENLWAILDRSLSDRIPSNESELYAQLLQEWNKISPVILHSLIKSMPQRCQAVIDSQGYPTKY